MNEKHAINEINRGELARQVLDNPAFKESILSLRASLMEGFQNTKFKQSDERDEIWRKMQTINYIEEYLQESMQTGEMANESLTAFQKVGRLVGI